VLLRSQAPPRLRRRLHAARGCQHCFASRGCPPCPPCSPCLPCQPCSRSQPCPPCLPCSPCLPYQPCSPCHAAAQQCGELVGAHAEGALPHGASCRSVPSCPNRLSVLSRQTQSVRSNLWRVCTKRHGAIGSGKACSCRHGGGTLSCRHWGGTISCRHGRGTDEARGRGGGGTILCRHEAGSGEARYRVCNANGYRCRDAMAWYQKHVLPQLSPACWPRAWIWCLACTCTAFLRWEG